MSNLELKGLKGLRRLSELLDKAPTPTQSVTGILQSVPIDMLSPSQYQPRVHIDETALADLSQSIKAQGIIQPLIVRQISAQRYEIIAGERRWRAAKLAGLITVPVIAKRIDDNTAMAYALIENIHRQNLNPIEEAAAFARLQEEFIMTHLHIAEMVGRSRAAITNSLRLLTLSEPVKQLLQENKIEMGHARALLTLAPDKQILLARKIVEKSLTVRQTEKLAKAIKQPEKPQNLNINVSSAYHCDNWSTALTKKLSMNVKIKVNKKGTLKMIVDVNSSAQLEWLIEHLTII